MTPKQWEQVGQLYQEALELKPDDRAALLDGACGTDQVLRQEVEALLALHSRADGFLSDGAMHEAAKALAKVKSDSLVGERLGHYQILSLLGAGGMGEVYLAQDERLSRKVALKLLPVQFTQDTERVRRFEREARAVSALNHPNIITIHEIGEVEGAYFIVTEFIAGQTLRQQMAAAQMKLSEGLDVAGQVAGALAVAHEAGIVHRDIKPENVMLRPDGYVKVLDFGLAKLTEARSVTPEAETMLKAESMTRPGVVMGTISYMSPEQARGLKVDARTDLWSLGVVFYEMATGSLPFQGETQATLFDAILNRAPLSLTQLNPALPAELERIINKTLEKDSEHRYQTAKELLADLQRLKRDLDSGQRALASAPPSATRPQRRAWWLAALAVTGIILAVGLWLWLRSQPAPPKIVRSTQITRDGRAKTGLVTDGPRLYFSETMDANTAIPAQVSSVGGESSQIPTPFSHARILDISPSKSELLVTSRTSASGAGTQLWVLPVLGNSPRRLGDVVAAQNATWSPDGGQIVYAKGSELHLMKSDGTATRKLMTVASSPQNLSWSPDGKRLRFNMWDPQTRLNSLWEVAADGMGLRPLLPDWKNSACCGKWSPDGRYFIFVSGSNLWAWREKAGLFQKASPKPVQLTFGPLDFCCYVPSQDGRKLFAVGEQKRGELLRYDAKAQHFVSYLSGMSAECLSFSADGEWLSYVTYPEGNLWRSKADGSERLQLSFPPMRAHISRWSPDGKKLVFSAWAPGGQLQIYLISAEGGSPQLLTSENCLHYDPSWSPDGNSVVYDVRACNGATAIRLFDLRTRQVSILSGAEGKISARWSPDGRYIAAVSRDSRKLLLYDVTNQKWEEIGELSPHSPQWSHDGKYIYFSTLGQRDAALFRVRIADRKVEQVASLKDIRRTGSAGMGWWMGLTPDDSPLVLRDLGSEDIYALEWEAP